MSKALSRILPAVLLACAAACTTTDKDVPADQALGTPKQTVNYLRWAFTAAPNDDRPEHLWNCLSENFKTDNRITRTDLVTFWKDVDEKLKKYLGEVEKIEVVGDRPIDSRRWELDLESEDHKATLLFVLETQYEIRPKRRSEESASGSLRSMSEAVRYEGDKAVITLPNVKRKIDPESIYLVTLSNGWKIEKIVRHNLAELERSLKKAQSPAAAPASRPASL